VKEWEEKEQGRGRTLGGNVLKAPNPGSVIRRHLGCAYEFLNVGIQCSELNKHSPFF